MLIPYEPTRTLRSPGTGLLEVPQVNTKHEEAAFSYQAAYYWNQLPENLRQASSVYTFKTRLKA